jgi:hypothetical protein
MPQPTLLADLALLLAKSPEDVATEAFTLILGRSEAARHALDGLFEQWIGSREISVVRWKSQVVAADDSRTDMEGEDSVGRLCAIFENKFWAGLTPNQPAAYLRRLAQPPGLLAFVAPSTRLSVLTSELAIRAKDEGLGALEFQPVGVSQVAAVLGRTLVVTRLCLTNGGRGGSAESSRA